MEKLYAQPQKAQNNLEEKLNATEGEVGFGRAVIKKCVLDTLSDLVGKGNRTARKPYVREERLVTWMKEKMSTMKEELQKTGDRLNRATNSAIKSILSICDNMEFPTTGCYDLMYMKTKELGWKIHRIQNTSSEDSQGNITIFHRQVLRIRENYITELYNRPNQPENL